MKFIDEETAAAITSFLMDQREGILPLLGNGHSLAVLVPEIVESGRRRRCAESRAFRSGSPHRSQKNSPEAGTTRMRRVPQLMGVGVQPEPVSESRVINGLFRVLRPISAEETEIRHIALA